MIALVQRVSSASVKVDSNVVGEIGRGLLVFLCAERGDVDNDVEKLFRRVMGYRVFGDENGKMNRSVVDVGGNMLVVSQFTLAADTSRGMRPSFTPAATPEVGRKFYEAFLSLARTQFPLLQCGVFGADMKVSLVNDGPVTFWLRVGGQST